MGEACALSGCWRPSWSPWVLAGLGAAAPAVAGTASAAGIPTSITLASTYPQYYGPSFTERSVTLVNALVKPKTAQMPTSWANG